MADNKDYVSLSAEKGTINISEDVIAAVAANAVKDVDGVASLGRDSGEIWGKKPANKGVRVINNGEDVSVEVGVMVKRNAAVHSVGAAVQESVKSALESVTGAKVKEVNVLILGVQL